MLLGKPAVQTSLIKPAVHHNPVDPQFFLGIPAHYFLIQAHTAHFPLSSSPYCSSMSRNNAVRGRYLYAVMASSIGDQDIWCKAPGFTGISSRLTTPHVGHGDRRRAREPSATPGLRMAVY